MWNAIVRAAQKAAQTVKNLGAPQTQATKTIIGPSVTGGGYQTVNKLVTGSQVTPQYQTQQAAQKAGPGYKVVQTPYGPALGGPSYQPTSSAYQVTYTTPSGDGSSGGGYSGPGVMLPTGQAAFTDISFSDVAQQGRGEKDTYARRFGYPGWDEMVRAMNEPAPTAQPITTQPITAQPSQSSSKEAIIRRLGETAGAATPIDYSQYMSKAPSTIDYSQYMSKAPSTYEAGKPYATPETYKKEEGLWGAIKRAAGITTENIGTFLGLPEWGRSEALAGAPTPLTGVAPTSVAAGFRLPTVIGTGAEGGQVLGADALAALQAKAEEEKITELPPGGGRIITQNPEVGDLYQAIVDSINTMGAEQLAAVDTSSMDGWYQEALQASGMNEHQAALDTVNKQIQVVSDLLDNLDADITEESKNFLMTEAQRRRLVATRGKPLRDELTKLVAGASKYGVNIKNTLAMLEQQINLKKSEAQQRLEAQKVVQANKEARLRGLTALLPYTYPTAGQQLSSQTQWDIANLKNQEEESSAMEALKRLAGQPG